MMSSRTRRLFFSLVVLAAMGPGSLRVASADDDPGSPSKKGTVTRDEIWKDFIVHLVRQGRADLLPQVDERAERGRPVHEDVVHEDGVHDNVAPGRDPILPILLQMSKDLLRLQSLLPDADPLLPPETAADSPERKSKITSLLKTLSGDEDPYVRTYAELYRARHALAEGKTRDAIAGLDRVQKSPHFLSERVAHRQLVTAYRKINDDTLAIIELRLLLLNIAQEDVVERRWAEAELKSIRENHRGPLRDSATGARAASELISTAPTAPTDPTATDHQRRVERILDGVIKILDTSCPDCKNSAATARCKNGQCKKAALCKKCGACKACGKGKGKSGQAGKDGDPKGANPSDTPAKDTLIRKGETRDPVLRDPGHDSTEIWGRIKDREVARSLKEVWGKIPAAYRRIVAQYYLDITDLAPKSTAK